MEYTDENAVKTKSCMGCEHHKVINDPDPTDWFCDDDKAVVCTLERNPKQDVKSRYLAERSIFRAVQVGIRPYRLEKETPIPEWCPLNK